MQTIDRILDGAVISALKEALLEVAIAIKKLAAAAGDGGVLIVWVAVIGLSAWWAAAVLAKISEVWRSR